MLDIVIPVYNEEKVLMEKQEYYRTLGARAQIIFVDGGSQDRTAAIAKTYGKVIFLAYSGVFLNFMEKHRLGYFRYRLGHFDLGKVSLAGVLANLFLAAIVKSMGFLPQPISEKLVLVNVIFAITNILPIPPLDGANIMYASKTFYPVAFGAVISCGLLLLIPWLNVWLAIVTSLVIGIVTAFAFFNYVEPKL